MTIAFAASVQETLVQQTALVGGQFADDENPPVQTVAARRTKAGTLTAISFHAGFAERLTSGEVLFYNHEDGQYAVIMPKRGAAPRNLSTSLQRARNLIFGNDK